MTTLNTDLARLTHPQRKPFVRSHTFIDDVGSPPYSFFDETQDHLGGLAHALVGWKWTLDADDFVSATVEPNFLGDRMRVTSTSGVVTVAPKTTGLEHAEHGVWTVTGDAAAWNYSAALQEISLDGDFLFTAKVAIVDPTDLDTLLNGGFQVTTANSFSPPAPCGFYTGSDKSTWWVGYPAASTGPSTFSDTGVAVEANRWYRLQISRVKGAVRWFINGRLCLVEGLPGVYAPYSYTSGWKQVGASRRKVGIANNGFAIDCFHMLVERT